MWSSFIISINNLINVGFIDGTVKHETIRVI